MIGIIPSKPFHYIYTVLYYSTVVKDLLPITLSSGTPNHGETRQCDTGEKNTAHAVQRSRALGFASMGACQLARQVLTVGAFGYHAATAIRPSMGSLNRLHEG